MILVDLLAVALCVVGAFSLIAWTRDGLSLADWCRWVSDRRTARIDGGTYLDALGRVTHPSDQSEGQIP